jgi:putative peptidoglycan lipid II flippase
LLGLVAIKVLTPGYFASQNIRGPALIALAVLVITQCLNLLFVPLFAHAGLALAIGVGALINALWLLVGLLRSRTFVPLPGWGRFALQVLLASGLLAFFLHWASTAVPWIGLHDQKFKRLGLLLCVVVSAVILYFTATWATGLKLRQLLRR